MIKLYFALREKLESKQAVFACLIISTVFWFLIGALAGVVLALDVGRAEMVLSYATTIGACCSMIIGYVWGFIRLIKISE